MDPFILTKFDNSTVQGDADAIVSFIIFEWHDEQFLGIEQDDRTVKRRELFVSVLALIAAFIEGGNML